MSKHERVTYDCPECGYTNVWTRDEIRQRGEQVLYRGDREEIFSLPCKNPRITCPGRMRVAVPIEAK